MRINRNDCSGLVIDIQERLFPHMDQKDELLQRCTVLIRGLQVLDVPVMITEQYPKGLGPTLSSVKEVLESFSPIEKIAFSCCDEPLYGKALDESKRRKVIICGIEAHVCVQQTVIDLIGTGHLPVVVADCISSRNPVDKKVALDRMAAEGAIITTCESILFELARVAGSEEFKAISQLVK
ncbi:MAG: hydrolase [Bacteroidales bacterium]|nr:hydrolase [Bacteroidales bacterium]